jgi:outer membrane protein OmpA-like peptidoglycan-associated protein
MKKSNWLRIVPSVVILMTVGFGAAHVLAADADEAKLKELERAMKVAAEPKKPRTRSIVFDTEPQQTNAAVQIETKAEVSAKRIVDCKDLPPNVASQAVDFAIQFSVNSAQISQASVGTLNAIGKILALSPDRCVIVEGHTDSSGNPDSNMALSRDRAISVVDYISNKSGLDAKRFVPIGKGSSDPLKNLLPRDPTNRRVVFKVVTG